MKCREDLAYSWEDLIEEINDIEDFNDKEKNDLQKAYQWLSIEFGQDFLIKAFKNRHPITQYVINSAPWTRRWFMWFEQALRNLKEQKYYERLLAKLKNPQKFNEGISLLETAFEIYRMGYSISFEPTLNINGKNRKPDLRLTDKQSGEILYCEVSVQYASENETKAIETYNAVTELLFKYSFRIKFCGEMKRWLSKPHLAEIVNKLDLLIIESLEQDKLIEYIDDENIVIAIAPKHFNDELKEWAKSRGMRDVNFSGPCFGGNDIIRAISKIKTEQAQLPSGYKNIIVIKNNYMHSFANDIEKTIKDLEETLYEFPHIAAIVNYSNLIDEYDEESIFEKGAHRFITKYFKGLISGYSMVLINRFCSKEIDKSFIENFYNLVCNIV